MRGLRSFLVLVVIGAGLSAYLYFVESKRDPSDADKKEKVFTVESEKIDELNVKSESGERTTLKKSGSEWQIVAPVAAPPDTAAVSGLTSNLSSLELQRVIDDNPQDLAEYGLAQPRLEVGFKAGGQEHRLLVGRKTPAATDLYAKLGDQKRVFLIPGFVDTTFNKTTFDLRDKTVLKVEPDKIETASISSQKRTLQFAKADGEWKLTAPVKVRGDFTTIDRLVSRLNTLQMKSLVAPEAASLAEYGLDTPEATIQLGSGSSQATLLLGKTAGDGAVYAKDQSRPAIVTVDATLIADVTKDMGEYRQKDLFDGRAFNATRLEITRGGQSSVFEKTKTKNKDGQTEEKWKQSAPTARDVDQSTVDNLISAVTASRATSFVDSAPKAGLDKPELVIALTTDEGKRVEKVSFSRSGAEGYGARDGEPGVAKVDAATIDNIVKSLEGIK
jgi:Domain of unknown function (DUF4340)